MCTPHCCVCAPRRERGRLLRSRGAIRRGKKQKVKQSQIFGAKYRAFGLAPKKETAAKGIKARLSLGQQRESDFTAPPPPIYQRSFFFHLCLPSQFSSAGYNYFSATKQAGGGVGGTLAQNSANGCELYTRARTRLQPLFTNVKYHKRGGS